MAWVTPNSGVGTGGRGGGDVLADYWFVYIFWTGGSVSEIRSKEAEIGEEEEEEEEHHQELDPE